MYSIGTREEKEYIGGVVIEVMKRSAIISNCKLYRYYLERIWNTKKASVMFIMLNPSTADGTNDDPTIRRCIKFAAGWGYGGLIVTNLFAYRTTNPKKLLLVDDPIGPKNNEYIELGHNEAITTIAAWGTKGQILNRNKEVIEQLADLDCIGITQNNHPNHPLYMKADSKLFMYTLRGMMMMDPNKE